MQRKAEGVSNQHFIGSDFHSPTQPDDRLRVVPLHTLEIREIHVRRYEIRSQFDRSLIRSTRLIEFTVVDREQPETHLRLRPFSIRFVRSSILS